MIPKKIYFYWGNETISFLRYMTLYSFVKFNKDWEVILIKGPNTGERKIRWITSEKQDKTNFSGKDYSDQLSKLNIKIQSFSYYDILDIDCDMSDVHIKDILNWYILSTTGGVVADMDILFLKPLELSMVKKDIGIVKFSSYPQKDYIPVTFMTSKSQNEFFEQVYKLARVRYNPFVYESVGTCCIEETIKKYNPNNIHYLPEKIVFPYAATLPLDEAMYKMFQVNDNIPIPNESIGMHWYGGNHISQHFNNLINHTNCGHDNIICKLIRGIYDGYK